MKVTKEALLEAIDKAFADRERQNAEWEPAVAAWREQQKQKWITEKGPQWRALRDLITKSLNNGRPITSDDVAKVLTRTGGYSSSYISDHTFPGRNASPPSSLRHNGQKVYQPQLVPERDLLALKAFLVSSPDDVFSMEALSRLGFKAPAWVFRAAVANQQGAA